MANRSLNEIDRVVRRGHTSSSHGAEAASVRGVTSKKTGVEARGERQLTSH